LSHTLRLTFRDRFGTTNRPIAALPPINVTHRLMPITLLELLLRLAASALLGGAIGFERERREQPAGLRTHLLVALASATFMIVSTQFEFYQRYLNDGVIRADVGRIASNVVVGIGFLGGGAILHSGLQIKGLTTAASLWLVAALGLASGAGMFVLALLTAAISLFALVGLRYLERRYKHTRHLVVRVDLDGALLARTEIEKALAAVGVEVKEPAYFRDKIRNRSGVTFEVSLPRQDLEDQLLPILENLPSVRTISVRQGGS
jgi:putative Mg2+ transporter-C (MgtC) family protein